MFRKKRSRSAPAKPSGPWPDRPADDIPQIDLGAPVPFTSNLAHSPRGTYTKEDRDQDNYDRDMDFFETLFRAFYNTETGERDDRLGTGILYGLMSSDKKDYEYLIDTVTEDQIQALIDEGATSGRYRTTPQLYAPAEAMTQGDYWHLQNDRHVFDPTQFAKRMRRLVVNVTTQEHALTLAKALTHLFDDPDMGPLFHKLKVFLSTEPTGDDLAKNDKLVLYYLLGGNPGDFTDWMGEALLDHIAANLPPEAGKLVASPFYSRVAEAVSWSEEPEHHMPGAEGVSFTDSRAAAIKRVLDDADAEPVTSGEDLAKRVFRVFEEMGIPSLERHRHLDPS
ncbi:T3SS effector HopA1 family protein [Herbidospora cretacea]|uniref:T3SS effector HopA1 family protein n=1 Tax=Herbidospora cretacea TaxID=28444 RepID=UPI000774CE23|nr:T3SS effector HopA1 family protein [Herbidospora cretacea]